MWVRNVVFMSFLGFALLQPKAAANEELRAFGEYLSAECVTCHQISGEHDGIPSIVGWDAWAFETVMAEYRDKTRSHQVMQTIARSLSDEEIKALAIYFGSIKPKDH